MYWGRPRTPGEIRLASLQNGICTQRIYWPGGGFTRCAEYETFKGYCQLHQPGGSMQGVFERMPVAEPLHRVRTDIDTSGTDEWSDGRWRNRKGQYVSGGKPRKPLQMDTRSVYNRRRQRKYRASKKRKAMLEQRREALADAQRMAAEEARLSRFLLPKPGGISEGKG